MELQIYETHDAVNFKSIIFIDNQHKNKKVIKVLLQVLEGKPFYFILVMVVEKGTKNFLFFSGKLNQEIERYDMYAALVSFSCHESCRDFHTSDLMRATSQTFSFSSKSCF